MDQRAAAEERLPNADHAPASRSAGDRPLRRGVRAMLFLRKAIFAWLVMWLAIALSGAAFGTCVFPIVGTILGFLLAGASGGVTSLLAVALHTSLRGRAPLRFAASFAGATAGVVSWGLGDFESGVTLPPPNPVPALTALIGGFSAAWATSRLLKSFGMIRLGAAKRRGQFSLADLMLLTAWSACLLTTCRLLINLEESDGLVIGLWCLVIVLAMATVEGVWRLCRLRRRRIGGVVETTPEEQTQR